MPGRPIVGQSLLKSGTAKSISRRSERLIPAGALEAAGLSGQRFGREQESGLGRLPHDLADPRRVVAAVDLHWLSLGAGGHFVRLNGRVYEALAARLGRRPARDLYHSALQVEVAEGTFVIEQAPVHDRSGNLRGVVAEGPVGTRWAGRFRVFRYEIRLWLNGHIPDIAAAADSPRRLSSDEDRVRRVLDLVAQVPTPVWGRDQFRTGEMWNSNSVIAWVIARSGIDTESIQPPTGGRAPGWQAGLAVARRQDQEAARAVAAAHLGA